MNFKPAIAGAALLLVSQPGFSQTSERGSALQGDIQDAWISGKVEMAYTLNAHLNPFDISTTVDDGVVSLSGMVDSDIDRDLAEQIARGIGGVTAVNNDLKTGMPAKSESATADNSRNRDFPTWFDDATTTAAVKTNLIRNSNTEGLEIDVDTHEDVVTLSGSVASDEEKDLAGEIARNTGDVREVRNLLVVSDS